MDSSLQQTVASIQLKDYLSFVTITAVVYDYSNFICYFPSDEPEIPSVLTFSDEIEYIWATQPWTWMSTMFVLARYSGLCATVSFGLWGSSFLPGSEKSGWLLYNRCNIIGIFGAWSLWVFMCTADLVMILRLWVLYNRSRTILGTLLTFYVIIATSFVLFYALSINQIRHSPVVETVQVLGYSFCAWDNLSSTWSIALDISQIIFCALICLFIAIKSCMELLQAYRATKSFQLNRYRRLLVCEGTIYFTALTASISILGFSILDLLNYAEINLTDEWRTLLTVALALQMPPITLVPRFILSLRKLYLHDAQGRRTSDMDTAFGLTSSVGRSAAVSAIEFAVAGQENEGDDQADEIQLEEMVWEARSASSSVTQTALR